jgi:hypothetical protein
MTQLALPPSTAFPHQAYYSTQPFLAWCLNHYVYSGSHYVWASPFLFPYRALNPKSSNPYQIFQDLYQPSYDRDAYDSFISQKRVKLRAGVEAIVQSLKSSHPLASRYNDLLDICDGIDETFFWPVIYIIDNDVAVSRGALANSALVGSDEKLIKDLQESEFTMLVPDFDRQSPVKDDFADFVNDKFSRGDDAIKQLLTRI